jgi:hypothetical protein
MPYENTGTIERVVADSLAYLVSRADGKSYSFTPESLDSYRGQPLEELGVVLGAEVSFRLDRDTGQVTNVAVEAGVRTRSLFGGGQPRPSLLPPPRRALSTPRYELHPDDSAARSVHVPRALRLATRDFGKLINTDRLRIGDLLLTREAEPEDTTCGLITEVQAEGGYSEADAQWVHAAMYLGDGANVVEATVDGLLTGGDVRMTSLDNYCDGKSVLRFRRPLVIQDERLAWKMCIRALSRLGQPYNVISAAKMWFEVIVSGGGFFDQKKRPTYAAVVCSTLYADSYNEATRQSLGEVNGACVPAWLSLSEDFVDVKTEWLEIERA